MQVDIYVNGSKLGTGSVVLHAAQQLAPGRSTKEWAQVSVNQGLALTLFAVLNDNNNVIELAFTDGSKRRINVFNQANGVIEGELL